MIAFIKGNLEIKTKGYIIVETSGIGYKIYMPESAISKLGEIGKEVKVYTFMRVREDDISLYRIYYKRRIKNVRIVIIS